MKLRPTKFVEATHYLWDGAAPRNRRGDVGTIYSCNALLKVCPDFSKEVCLYESLLDTNQRAFGFCFGGGTFEDRQNVRFMFLYLAYLIAKDGGL